ncbi:hypothetical protein L6452_22545 [Arctium lappa]|uniref:Uncharacterized protein n=1 Tax=Arctium lappa TaxID=4217 RepID=A0ACB9AZ81_ARCLA|nr:hypothetical protein L6452_22545 [Arctium lappa]
MASSKSSKASKTTTLFRETLAFPACNQVACLSADVDHPEFNHVSLFHQKTPLQHAFTASTKMSKMLLSSFWLTCKYDSETHQVSASVLSSEEHPDLSFGVEDVRSILRIPEFDVYAPFPTGREHEEVVTTLNYVHEGKTKGSDTLLRKNMGVVWNYFFYHIIYCISHKTSGWDQSPAAISRLAHALIFMRRIDFAQVIFDSLVTAITPPRTHNVPLPRFISLIINEKLSAQLRADVGMISFFTFPNPIWGTLLESGTERLPLSQSAPQSVVPSIPKSTRAKSVAIKKKKAAGNDALASMTMPLKQPSVAAPVISSTSSKQRGSKSLPWSRSKRLRKPMAEPHSPSTDSQKSEEVEISPFGPRGSAKTHPTSSKSSPQGLVVQMETLVIPSPQFKLRDEDELASSPDQRPSSPQHNLSPGVTPEDIAHIDCPPKRQSPSKDHTLPHDPPTPTADRAGPSASSSSAPQVPISIPVDFIAEIFDTNRQVRMLGTQYELIRKSLREPELLNSMDINNTSLAELLQLVKEQNSECIDLNRDIFRCLDVRHHEIDGLRTPLSDALDAFLKEVIKLIDNNNSLTLSMAALKAASDARDQDLIRLWQQASDQTSVNSHILSALQGINQLLDSMPATVAQYCARSLDIDIMESAFTADDRTTLDRIDRCLGRVSAKVGLSSPARTEGEKQVEGEYITPQIIITSTSQREHSTAAAPTETETAKVLASAEEEGTDHPKVFEESEGDPLPKKDKGKKKLTPDEVVA